MSMNWSFGLKRLLGRLGATVLAALVLALGTAPARADIVLGNGSAASGGQVSLTVSGLTDLFFGADLVVGYDPAFLTFVGVQAASFPLTATANVGSPAPGQITLTVTPDTVITGLDYFNLLFTVDAAAGSTMVDLLAGGYLAFQDPLDPLEARVEDILQTISATVTVLGDPNGVPIANTLALSLAGLALLALPRRRFLRR